MSLSGCLKKLGKNVAAEDRAAIQSLAAEFRKSGMNARDAGAAAVRAQMESLGEQHKALSAAPGGVKVFHGTKAEVRLKDLSKTLDLGPHFTTSRETAELFANSEGTPGRVLEGRANFQKPLELPDLNGWFPTNVAAAVDEAHGIKAGADGQTPLQARVWGAMEKAKADYFDAQPEAYQQVRNKVSGLSAEEKALKERVFSEGMERSQKAGYDTLKNELRAAGYDSIKYKNMSEGEPVDTFIALDMAKVEDPDAAASRSASPESNADAEPLTLDQALAQKIAAEHPDMQVTLPGSDERLSVADAMQRIAEEQKQDGQWADLVKVAVECALSA